MNVTKQQIVNGAIKYMKDEVIAKITDKPFKMAAAVFVSMLENNPAIADKFFENDIVAAILNKKADGTYDIEKICETLEKTLTEYGDFPLKIPPIKFISPTEKELNFSGRDIRTLKDCIVGGLS